MSPDSSADFFLLYLQLTAVIVESNANSGFPAVTATATPVGLDVCTEGQTPCDVFSDFLFEDGLLASFSINGVSLDARFGAVAAPRSFESLTFEAGISFRRITQQQLTIIIVMSVEPGSTGAEIRWPEAMYTDANGTPLRIDIETSLAPSSVPGGARVGALLRFPDDPPAGTLTVPVSSDGFATTATARSSICPSDCAVGQYRP